MAIYLEYEGIDGDATAEGYEKHVKIDTVQFGVGRGISMEPGNLANREATKPTISEVSLTKFVDNATISLFTEAIAGAAGKTVKIKFVQTGTDKLTEYMCYELTDCLVSGYNISASSEGNPSENVTLSFSKITVNFSGFDATNTSASPQRVAYDLATAKKQ